MDLSTQLVSRHLNGVRLDPKRVHKPVKKLRNIVKQIPKQPSPEQVHDLRTNTRRPEAVVTALSLDTSRNVKDLLNDLFRVRKRAGKVRDMDVLTAYAASLHDGEDQDCKVQLLEHLLVFVDGVSQIR